MDWKKKFEVAGLGGAKSSRIIVHQTATQLNQEELLCIKPIFTYDFPST